MSTHVIYLDGMALATSSINRDAEGTITGFYVDNGAWICKIDGMTAQACTAYGQSEIKNTWELQLIEVYEIKAPENYYYDYNQAIEISEGIRNFTLI